ncbi:Uncharacterised protein [Acinetobacter haemolyticus]|uniref:Uncharacterized protein n=1 Tax=Acinetobacter haemolyticus CIP 64.3 = MTCC 9819 TaxID=1217659 RepID=N9GKX4_ACIHA|nr:hypothetical protein F927_01862 [Acinetobacter haemolyticus CIP 64.3 = MTCC 9819]SPT47978.1 Uncharacterised protein [Acinetobacter haemolyticus]SUU57195.1 Uncharacterised protein [Acinetobacter haemolyticus]
MSFVYRDDVEIGMTDAQQSHKLEKFETSLAKEAAEKQQVVV